MTTLGPMARNLDDLELALRIIAGPGDHDTDVPPVPLPPSRRLPLSDLRLCVASALPETPVSQDVRRQVERVADAAATNGARADENLTNVDWESLHTLFADLLMTITGVFAPGGRDEQTTLAWYLESLARRDHFITVREAFFADVDALVLPAGATSAFAHCEPGTPIHVDGQQTTYWSIPALLTFCNLTGLPGLVVPAGMDDSGLPVSAQLVGRRWSEMRLLDIARELEWFNILPGFQSPLLNERRSRGLSRSV